MSSMLALLCLLSLAQSSNAQASATRKTEPPEPFIKIAAPVGDRWTNLGLSIPFDVKTGPSELRNVHLSCYADCLIVGEVPAESSDAGVVSISSVLPPATQLAFSCHHLFRYPKLKDVPLTSAVLTIVGEFTVPGQSNRQHAEWQFQLSTDRKGMPVFTLLNTQLGNAAMSPGKPSVNCAKVPNRLRQPR